SCAWSMTMRILFGRFCETNPIFPLHLGLGLLSRLNRSYAARKIVIPDRKLASGISAYGKWIENAGALCRCRSVTAQTNSPRAHLVDRRAAILAAEREKLSVQSNSLGTPLGVVKKPRRQLLLPSLAVWHFTL